MTHPNDMSAWSEIACQRGCAEHKSRLVAIDLGARHGYADLPQVPRRLARRFEVEVWDPSAHPVDGGPYCPAHDAVSETIVNQGIWEPSETVLTLAACSAAAGTDARFVDFGSQIGWFSLLAASCGVDVLAIEADAENRRLHRLSFQANDWYDFADPLPLRIGPDTPALSPQRIALAKVDVEGAEREALRMLWPSIEAGLVDHILLEVTPLFAGWYGQLVADIVGAGFSAWRLPPKSHPPAPLEELPGDLRPGRLPHGREAIEAEVATWHQEMVWFSRVDARW